MKSASITAANKKRAEEGLKAYEHLKLICQNPMKVNEELLLKIIRENEETEYGKKYDFKNIHSIEDYQKKVPVTKYGEYSDYMKRMTGEGEKNLLCVYPIEHFNGSSGTTGDVKYIPMSQNMKDYFMTNLVYIELGVLTDSIGDEWTEGRCLWLMECPSENRYLASGVTFGAISSYVTRQFRTNAEDIFVSPDEAVYPENGTDTKYLHSRFVLMDADATGMMAAYLSYIVFIFKYIENNWEMLVDDIEAGTISHSVELPEDVRVSLEGKLKPMPERAAELREIFKGGFDEPFVPKVWKNMKYIQGIGTGGFKLYADMLKENFTGRDIAFVKMGIMASEGCFTSIYRVDSEDTVIIPDSVFFEFLPMDAEDDFSKIVTIDGLEQGKEYEIIITNLGGLYRYRMRDAVRVVSKFENTPTLEFLYRIDQTVNILGEKTTEATLRTAVNNIAESLSLEIIDFSVYADITAAPPRYQFFLEIGRNPKGYLQDVIREALEKELLKLAPALRDLQDRKLCQRLKVNFLQPDTYLLWRDMSIYNGINSNQLKPIHIIRNEQQRKFFFGLTESSSEPQ